MTKPNNAIILLAGFGSRLRPLTDSTHKALIEVGGKSILERQITQLQANGIKNFHLVLGHRADDVKNFANSKLSQHGHFFYYDNPLYDETNNAFSLMQALQKLPDSFILLDGDVILSDTLIQKLCVETKDNLLLCDTDESKLDEEAMKVRVDKDNTIVQMSKGISVKEATGESIGVSLYQKDWALRLNQYLSEIMKDRDNWNFYYEDMIQQLIDKNEAPSDLKLVSTENHLWVEIDDHKDLEKARQTFSH